MGRLTSKSCRMQQLWLRRGHALQLMDHTCELSGTWSLLAQSCGVYSNRSGHCQQLQLLELCLPMAATVALEDAAVRFTRCLQRENLETISQHSCLPRCLTRSGLLRRRLMWL